MSRAGIPPMRGVAVCGLVYLAVALVFLQLALLGAPGRADAPVSGDLLAYYYPSLRYGYAELAAGRLPLWNPHQAAGVPFIAALHHGFFYPLYAPLLVLDTATALDVHLVLHLVIAGLGAFLFCRHLGVGSAAAFLAGLIYTYHGGMMIKVYFPDFLTSSAWIPYQFLFVDRVLQGRGWRSAAALAAVLGLCFLGGHGVQFLYFAALAVLPLVAVRGVQLWRGDGRRALLRAAAQLAVAAVLGGLLGAVRLLPMATFVADSWRPPDMGAWASLYAVSPPVLREGLLTPEPAPPGNELAPNSADRLRTIYVGTVSLCLALLGLAYGRPRAALLALATTGLATVLYVLGPHGPLFPLLVRLPLGTRFQGLDRALVLLGFAVAVLAAAGVDALLRRAAAGGARREQARSALCIFAAVAVVMGLGVALGAARGVPRLLAYGAAAIVALAAVRFGNGRMLRGAGLAALAAVLLVDLFHAQQHRGRLPSQLDAYFRRNEALYEQIRARQGLDRTYIWSSFQPGHPLAYRSDTAKAGLWHGIWQATDYDPLCSVRFTAYLDRLGQPFVYPICHTTWQPSAGNLRLIDLLGVRFFAIANGEDGPLLAGAPELAARATRLWSDGRVSLYEYSGALPRAFLVDRVEAETDPARVLDRLASLDARHVALVEGPAPAALSAGTGEAAIVSYAPQRVEIDTDAPQPSFLVLTDQFDAGWRATVDGSPASIFRTDYLFRGVPVAAGRHRVVFEYRPRSFVLGAAGSALGVVLLAALWIGGDPRRVRPAAAGSAS